MFKAKIPKEVEMLNPNRLLILFNKIATPVNPLDNKLHESMKTLIT